MHNGLHNVGEAVPDDFGGSSSRAEDGSGLYLTVGTPFAPNPGKQINPVVLPAAR
jgi:hypothetical protein